MKFLLKDYGLLAIGSVLLATSCTSETPWSASDQADGKIILNLKADGKVQTGTRSDDVSPKIPNQSEFSISLQGVGSNYSGSWRSLDAFNKEDGFPMGNYIISASFGEMDSEGFNNPYFYGESNVNVIKGSESKAEIVATLKNAMISVRYTEEFSKFFPAYDATVTTKGHQGVIFVQTETRPAYIAIEETTISLNLTNNSNQQVKVNPIKEFTPEPQKHYIVTFGVSGNTNVEDAFLSIEWSEDVEDVEEKITLSDKLFSAPAPTVTLEGVTKNDALFEGVDYEEYNPEFHIVAIGGLKTATLKLSAEENNGTVPAGFNEVELVGNAKTNQYQLGNYGINCSGFNSTDIIQFAVVNLKDYVKSLTPGKYTASLNVEDLNTTSIDEEVKFNVEITELKYRFLSYENPDFMTDKVTVYVETNCEDLKNQFQFFGLEGSEQANLIAVKSSELKGTQAPQGVSPTLDHVYKFELLLPEIIDDCRWKVRVQTASKESREIEIDVNMPDFTVETDAFAKKVRFRITPETASLQKFGQDIFNDFKFYKRGTLISSGYSYDPSSHILTLTDGITPKTTYNDFVISYGKSIYNGHKDKIASFVTEEDAHIPNEDFNTTKNLLVDPIDVGGPYETRVAIWASHQQITSSINRFVPAGEWATLNDWTCYEGSTNNNTWYKEPSTFKDGTFNKEGAFIAGNDIVIRSVGFNHNGRTLNESKNGTSRIYYGTDKPKEDELESSYGELFLGSYVFNGRESRSDGVSFYSRPSCLSFAYQYTSVANEEGYVYIKIKGEQGEVLSQGSLVLSSTNGYVDKSIYLNDYPFNVKAKTIEISFKSSNVSKKEEAKIEFPLSLDEGRTDTTYLTDAQKDANDYVTFAKGSELKISNVHLEY